MQNPLELYTSVGPTYQEAFIIPPQLKTLQWLLSTLPPKSHVLDIGCGTGRPAGETLVKAGHKFTGIDLTPAMVAKAKEQLPDSDIQVGDATKWTPPQEKIGSYDAVISYYVFLLGITNADTRVFFPRAYSWLKPGGIFVFGTLPGEGKDHQPTTWLGREILTSSLTAEETRSAIQEAGFEILKEEEGKFSPEKAPSVGLCKEEDVWEEEHLIFMCTKPE